MACISNKSKLYSKRSVARGFKFDPKTGGQTVSQLVETLGIEPLRLGRTFVGLSMDDIGRLEKALNRRFDESLAYPPA